jgi:hypothetical protein
MKVSKFLPLGAAVFSLMLVAIPSAHAAKDPCDINQRKLAKAESSKARAEARLTSLGEKQAKQEAKFERGREKKRGKTLSAREKNFARYSPDCLDSSTPPTVDVTPTHTDDSSARCAGARNKEDKLFTKQTQNEAAEFPTAKWDKKRARAESGIAKIQTKIEGYQEYLANNCGG